MNPSYQSLVPRYALASIAITALGCGGIRFRDQPIVWAVADTAPIEEPEEREYLRYQYFADLFALRRSERALGLPDHEPAWNANALEEVPDSTWFENRIGRREMTPVEIAHGAAVLPAPKPPFTIKSGKTGGGNLGFVVKDAGGRSFLIKRDRPENPEMQTGTGVIVGRLVWAFGFHVPADYVFYLRREDIVIGPKATAKDAVGDEIPYTEAMLQKVLDYGPPPKDGLYRVSASEFLKGIPKGGFAAEGTRDDDPNDVVPHEHRRELRGLRILSAWLNHTDMKEDNTLDMYVEEGGRKFLKHHLIDFGEALGGHAAEKNRKEDGYEYYVDTEMQGKALLSFGLWVRPWENMEPSPYRSIGLFSAKGFDPRIWREAYPYWPFMETDATDAFWAAKIIMRFSREHIAAAVAEGKLTEPGASAYLVDALVNRRDAIGRIVLEALSPLDAFDVKPGALCATDLAIHHELATVGAIERLEDGDVVASGKVGADARGCVSIPAGEGYQVVTLRVRRGTVVRPPMEVHLRGGAKPRVLGLVRDAR